MSKGKTILLVAGLALGLSGALMPAPASAGLGKLVNKAKDKAKDAANKAKDAANKAKDVANKAVDQAKVLADKAAQAAKDSLAKAGEWTKKGLAATTKFLKDAYAKLSSLAKAAYNKLLEVAADTVSPILKLAIDPLTALLKPIANKLAFLSGRRAESALCASTAASMAKALPLKAMASTFGDYFAKALKLGALELLTGKLTKTWTYFKSNAAYAKQGPGGANVPENFQPKSFTDSVKSKLKASVVGIAAFAALVEALVQFPTAYLVGAAGCAQHKEGGSRNAYRNCYLKNFLTYAKGWLFDGFLGIGLSPLEATIIPAAATTIGGAVSAAVSAALAAMSGGLGMAVAPYVGAIVALAVNTGLKTLVGFAAKAAFYNLYVKTTWKASCKFFRSLVSQDVLDHFGPKASGAKDDAREEDFCP